MHAGIKVNPHSSKRPQETLSSVVTNCGSTHVLLTKCPSTIAWLPTSHRSLSSLLLTASRGSLYGGRHIGGGGDLFTSTQLGVFRQIAVLIVSYICTIYIYRAHIYIYIYIYIYMNSIDMSESCNNPFKLNHYKTVCICRADSRLAPSQWETSLQSNAVSHWMDTNLESALHMVWDVLLIPPPCEIMNH